MQAPPAQLKHCRVRVVRLRALECVQPLEDFDRLAAVAGTADDQRPPDRSADWKTDA
jgi:hypothetical protein